MAIEREKLGRRPVLDGPDSALRVVRTGAGRSRGRARQTRRRVRGRELVHRMPPVRAHRPAELLHRDQVRLRAGSGPVGGWAGSRRGRRRRLPGAVHPLRERARGAPVARARRREAVEGRGNRWRREGAARIGLGVSLWRRRVAEEESRSGWIHRLALAPRQGQERGLQRGGRRRGCGGCGGCGGVRGIRVGGGDGGRGGSRRRRSRRRIRREQHRRRRLFHRPGGADRVDVRG